MAISFSVVIAPAPRYDEEACNLLFAATLGLGAILTALIKEDLRRQRAHETHSSGVKHESTNM